MQPTGKSEMYKLSRGGPLTWLMTWAVLVVIVLALLVSINGPRLVRLVAGSTETEATVIAKDSANHRSIVGRFSTKSGGTIEVPGRLGPPNPDFDRVRLGDRVLVNYLETDPATVEFGDPGRQLQNEFLSAAVAALVLPTFGVGVVYLQRARWRPSRRRAARPDRVDG